MTMTLSSVVSFLWDLFKALLLINADLLLASMALSAVLGILETILGVGGKNDE